MTKRTKLIDFIAYRLATNELQNELQNKLAQSFMDVFLSICQQYEIPNIQNIHPNTVCMFVQANLSITESLVELPFHYFQVPLLTGFTVIFIHFIIFDLLLKSVYFARHNFLFMKTFN